jgi:hypothetical protein
MISHTSSADVLQCAYGDVRYRFFIIPTASCNPSLIVYSLRSGFQLATAIYGSPELLYVSFLILSFSPGLSSVALRLLALAILFLSVVNAFADFLLAFDASFI